jgi:signal transduction histidine kinase
LRNILKYAKGENIEVDLILNNNKLKMRIADDGIGFDKNNFKQGIGLANMKRRVELFFGNFQIFTSPGSGCEISIEIPLINAPS